MAAGYLTTADVAERLQLDEDQVVERIRRRGPRGVVRTNDGRLLVPPSAVDELAADQPPT